MLFLKNFNNNAALVKDNENVEWIVIGNGIGFGKHPGEQVDATKISRRFVAAEADYSQINAFKDIKPQALSITTKIVKLVEPILDVKFSNYQYLALADHVDFALKRALENIDINDGTVRWEVEKLFPVEYQAAVKALELINREAKVTLPKSESILLTYHFVNSESDNTKLQETIRITQLIKQITDIIQYQFGVELDADSFNFNRFVTHLRSLIIQHLSHTQQAGNELDPSLLQLMQLKYPEAYQAVERIDRYLSTKLKWQLQPDEKVYLTLHIWRVTHRQLKQT